MKKRKRKAGRPKSKDARRTMMHTRVSDAQLARWKKAADKLGLSRWVREMLDRAAERSG